MPVSTEKCKGRNVACLFINDSCKCKASECISHFIMVRTQRSSEGSQHVARL